MKIHKWSDVVKKRYTLKQIAEFRAAAAKELRETVGKTKDDAVYDDSKPLD